MTSLSEDKLNKNHSENRNNEHLRRNRPRQEIYVPGSGPLKKSNNFERCDEQQPPQPQHQPSRDHKDQMRNRDRDRERERERDRYQESRGRDHDRDYNRYSECDRSHSRDFRKSNTSKPKTSDQDFSSGSNYRKNPKMNYRHENYPNHAAAAAAAATAGMGPQGVVTGAGAAPVPLAPASDNKQWNYDRHHNNNNNNVRVSSNYSNRNKPNEYAGKFVRRTNSSSYPDKNRFSVNLPPRLRKFNQNQQSTAGGGTVASGEKNHSNFSHPQNDYFFQKKQPQPQQQPHHHQPQQPSSFKNNEFSDSGEMMKSVPKSSEKLLPSIESKLEHLNVINCHDIESANRRVQPIIIDNVDALPEFIGEVDPIIEYSDCDPNKHDDLPVIENGDSNSFVDWNELIENDETAKNNNSVVKTQMETTKHCETVTTLPLSSPKIVENSNSKRVQETNERTVPAAVTATATASDQTDNWREQNRRNEELRRNSDLKVKSNAPGIIFIPQQDNYHQSDYKSDKRKSNVRHFENSSLSSSSSSSAAAVATAAAAAANYRNNKTHSQSNRSRDINIQSVNLCMSELSNYKNPNWYDENSSAFRNCKNPKVIFEVINIDLKVNWILTNGYLISEWKNLLVLREGLKSKLQFFLLEDLKFSQVENIESHFWKLLYYNVIEFLRKSLVTLQSNPDEKSILKNYALHFIDDGLKFFKSLIAILEEKYEFRLKEILETDLCLRKKATGFTGLALNSVQKLCLFLGDLTRYNEQINETLQIFKSKQWYLKARHINPKNGKSYNQLAVVAHNEKQKFETIYLYVRSLMSSNPILSAKESLKCLFEETKKKYELDEKQRLKDDRSDKNDGSNDNCCKITYETWIHPANGERTSNLQTSGNQYLDEQLRNMDNLELQARFNISFLHIHGKLFTKIEMDTFNETSTRMLHEFNVLLNQYLNKMPDLRLLKLMALNMFAIENSQLKDIQQNDAYRLELQERVLSMSLQMFNIMLDKCIKLLHDNYNEVLMSDSMKHLLPAINIWCDWMLCHAAIWNPPPITSEYQIFSGIEDVWTRLATLMNILENIYSECDENLVSEKQHEGFEPICLFENAVLAGYTPLMYNTPETFYTHKDSKKEKAETFLRIKKILFFGTVFLCGIDPQVLKLKKLDDNRCEYVSVVQPSLILTENQTVDCFTRLSLTESDKSNHQNKRFENNDKQMNRNDNDDHSTSRLTHLREQLQSKGVFDKKAQKSLVTTEFEVRPKYLVADTNCFIDHQENLEIFCKSIESNHYSFILAVPIVVLNELEGLSRGKISSAHLKNVTEEHLLKVSASAKNALNFLRSGYACLKCLTTNGTILSSLNFTENNDNSLSSFKSDQNDNRILSSCLNLCKEKSSIQHIYSENEIKKIVREVVLLTEDRNLKVKAITNHIPVRTLPDFLKWLNL